jgi:putative FmdB family regulatory protein
MPTYEFLCKKCKKVFEVSCSVREYERKKKKGIECTKCGSSEVLQQLSGFQVQTSKKS